MRSDSGPLRARLWTALALVGCGGGDASSETAVDSAGGLDGSPEIAQPPVDAAVADIGALCAPGEGFEKGNVLGDLAFPRCEGGGKMNLRDLCGAKVGWIRGYYGW